MTLEEFTAALKSTLGSEYEVTYVERRMEDRVSVVHGLVKRDNQQKFFAMTSRLMYEYTNADEPAIMIRTAFKEKPVDQPNPGTAKAALQGIPRHTGADQKPGSA